ncbi:prephenate dehydratase [Myxacorys almedinensis]|uniref:Prephenate dehydratase n=1 Tax=Myxacorys almedinensis A TaxID=2690445 RepID=A0A8J8CHS5_9CYAN|nr:prephenate dehydratase [Myxacorys almedinensis]NDJ17013.1 prephenate dehydratase [Myxacorys almedinensis A]
MTTAIAHLGPSGTYAEAAALIFTKGFVTETAQEAILCPYPSIAQTMEAVAQGEAQLAVVPIENSIEGSVTMTMDALWRLDKLQIRQSLVLPIDHALLSQASQLEAIRRVYSHPQALAQCQQWLDIHLPKAQRIATHSTTEALQHLDEDSTIAAIASQRAAQLYNLPILNCPLNDYPDNCTRFLVLGLDPSPGGTHTSLAFSVQANQPGVLLKPLQVFAERSINMSRIESRPTKRSLGDYVFFVDLEADARLAKTQAALAELSTCTETLKTFGSYNVVSP